MSVRGYQCRECRDWDQVCAPSDSELPKTIPCHTCEGTMDPIKPSKQQHGYKAVDE